MKKIIWIAHEANTSGANLCLLEYISILKELGYAQILILPHKGNMEGLSAEIGVKTVIIPFYDWIRPVNKSFLSKKIMRRILRNFYALIVFCNLFIKTKPDFVCSNTIVNGLGAIAAKILFKKHIWFIHEMGEEDFGFKLSLGNFAYALMNLTSQKFLINSDFVSKKFKKKLPSSKIAIVYNPVLVDFSFKPIKWISSLPLQLIMLGQISAIKGHMDAIRAVQILKNKGFNIKLNIYGKCEHLEYEKELHDAIKFLGLSDTINIYSSIKNPSEILTKHHILLVCSVFEAMGRVSLEAMKLGVFVIGSDVGGIKEIILDNNTGFLYKQGNPNSLADRITDFLSTKNKMEIISAGRKHANSLTKNGVKLFLKILNK